LVGDWAIYNGTAWEKIDNTDQVASVNGYTGVVVLTNTDVGAPSTSLTISAGTGLTGGGNLTTNRTISIANTAVTAASYGTASAVPTFTVNGQGQLTAAADVNIAITNTQVSGLGTMSTQNANSVTITGGSITGITDLAIADGGTGASNAADARTNLGVTATGGDTTYLFRANNLSDLASASTARTNLGLGTAATQDSTAFATAAQGAKADTAIQTLTSTDGSIVVTPTGTTIDLAVSAASPASTLLTQVRNTTGATLTKGTVVYISGATGQISTVSKAIATGDTTSAQTLGMITADLANNTNGYVTVFGLIQNIDTSSYTDGAQLYLSGTTAGAVTTTKPSAPIHLVYVGIVEYAHPTQGKILVKVQNGYELDEIHDVSIVSPVTGQTLVYNSSTDLWVNNTVSLTAGVNGTLPILNGGTGQTTANAAFNALAPSQTGNSGKYLTTDGTDTSWASNPLGTVTSVAATVPSFLSISGSPITTSGTLAFGLSGTALPTTSGGTGRTSFTSGGVVYASSTSALATGSALTFDGASLFVSGNLVAGSGNTTADIISKSSVATGGAGFSEFLFGNSSSNTRGYLTYSHANDSLLIGTAGSTKATLDSSGNLGLGVTPSAWSQGTAFEIYQKGYGLWNGSGNPSSVYMLANTYYNGGFKYANTGGYASSYYQYNGQHVWSTAASGTAGNAITFTQAMTLDASGNLLVGTTSGGSYKLDVVGNGQFSGTSTDTRLLLTATGVANTVIGFNNSGSTNFAGAPTGTAYLSCAQAYPLVFATSATERARIDSNGAFIINGDNGFTSDIKISASATSGGSFLFKNTAGSGQWLGWMWNASISGDGLFINFMTEGGGTSRGSIIYNRGAGLLNYNVTSDYRAKDINGPVVDSGALIDSVPVYMGKMKGATQERPMFIAHETPDYAHTGEKDAVDADGNPVYQQMDASALIPVMWAEIQSLRKRLADAGI